MHHGSGAEAKHRRKDFKLVWFGTSVHDDRRDLARDCIMAGINPNEGLAMMLPKVEEALAGAEIWKLVLAISKGVLGSKGLSGKEVAAIARQHLEAKEIA